MEIYNCVAVDLAHRDINSYILYRISKKRTALIDRMFFEII